MRELMNKVRWMLRRRRKDAELREELAYHLEVDAEERRDRGLPESEARLAARRALGNVTRIEEDVRAAWGWQRLQRLGQDVRYAARVLRRRPGFTVAAVLSLTLGIGANTAMFSILHAMLLETLPVHRPSELVQLTEPRRDSVTPYEAFTYNTYVALRHGSRLLSSVAAASTSPATQQIERAGEKHPAVPQLVSENFFEVLGVPATFGRVFREQPAGSPGEAIVVISDAYWRRQFGANPNALGTSLIVYRRTFTIAGIAPPRFRGVDLERAVDIWVPFEQAIPPDSDDRGRGRWMRVMGRLAPDSARSQADAEGTAIVGRPVAFRPGATGYSPLRRALVRPLLLVELVVALVLFITCANLTNLTLSSNLARDRELSVRRALGASRSRLIAQLVTESLLLSLAGGACALLAASWISGALLSFLPPVYAPALATLRFDVDLRMIAFAALLSGLTCIAFALPPAIRATRAVGSPGEGMRGSTARTQPWVSRGLVVVEVVMCTVLLMIGSVFLRSVQNLRGQDAGYTEDDLLVADVAVPFEYGEDRRDRLIDELRSRILALPGVEVAAYSHIGQLSGGAFEYRLGFPGQLFREAQTPVATEQRISPGFLAAMGTSIRQGRDFTAADTSTSTPVAIVNELFAARFFPGRSALGQRFSQQGGSRSGELMEIVGVVQDSKWVSLRDAAPLMYYRPYAQQGGTPVVRFAIRGAREPESLATEVVVTAQAIDRRIALTNVVPFREIINRSLLVERLVAEVSAAFGALALLVAAVGLYGVLAYGVARRRREIGVRIAVGASRRTVEWMFLRESFILLAAGFALGIPAAILLIRLVSSMLYGLGPQDPATIASVLLVLIGATAAASFFPARRAAAIDPIRALREE
jgi:predicted permease